MRFKKKQQLFEEVATRDVLLEVIGSRSFVRSVALVHLFMGFTEITAYSYRGYKKPTKYHGHPSTAYIIHGKD